ncbi:MAG: ATP-binding cassette domain-containing protein, partial [Dehalococcoidia bacterium]
MLTVDVAKRLDGFSLAVAFTAAEGITVLFGPSGAGKSLTLQAIAGTLTPDGGRIVVDGEALFDSASRLNVPPQRRRIGYVPQNYALFPHLTVADNIAFGLNSLGHN